MLASAAEQAPRRKGTCLTRSSTTAIRNSSSASIAALIALTTAVLLGGGAALLMHSPAPSLLGDGQGVSLALLALTALGTLLGVVATLAQRSMVRQADELAALRHRNSELTQQLNDHTSALELSEQRFRAIFNAQFQFIGLMTPDGVLIEANATALKAAGITEADVMGKPFWETAWWQHDSQQRERLRQAIREAAAGQHSRFEASHPLADGSLMWVDFSLTPFRDQSGNVVLLIPEGHDITARKHAEQALLYQEERFRSAFEHAPIGMSIVAPNGQWLRANKSMSEILGYSEAELQALDYRALTHPDDMAPGEALVERFTRGELRQLQMEKRYIHKDGHEVPTLLAVSAVRDQAGIPLYFIAQTQSIVERKRAEREMAARDALLRQFIKHSPAAIAMLDRDLRYVQASDRWLVDYQRTDHDIIGKSHYEVFPEIPQRWREIHQRVLAGAVERCEEDPFIREDGSITWLHWECRPWHAADGSIGGLIMFTQVITERKINEERLRGSLREKEVLLREIHHRVKNNLQIVSTLLDLQADHTDNAQALAMFEESRARVKSMALIHERLYRSQDIARVNINDYTRQLADDLYHSYKVSNDDIRLVLTVDLPPLPIDIAIPCGLLLNELISNSLKHAFTGRATGTLAISLWGTPSGDITLQVADDGVGFPPDTDFRNTASFGMQLVNTLVDQLHGSIDLQVQGGTTFTIRFHHDKLARH